MTDNGGLAETDLWDAVERADRALGEFGVVTQARTVRFQRVLPGPIERVWAYLTESEKRGRWLASGPMELRVGGFTTYGHITRCDPPRVLSYTWDEQSGVASEVTFELTRQGEEVLLVLTHRRLGDR